MNWCLPKKTADKFLNALKSGELNIEKLINLPSSKEKQAYLSKFVGEWNAKYVNILFESKLLLKNQQRGIARWILQTAGIKNISLEKFMAMTAEEQAKFIGKKADITILDKIKKLDKALNPKEGEAFLADIIKKRLGVSLTEVESKTITNLTKKAEDLFNPAKENWEQPIEYWQTRQQLNKFLRDASPEMLATTWFGKFVKGSTVALSIERAFKTAFDLSAAFRQGRIYFGTKEWNGAFKRMFGYAKDPLAMNELEVKIMMNKYSEFALKNKRELGLTLLGESFTQREEQFGAKIIEKIPLLKGSERAFVGFLNDLRFNRFVNQLEKLDKAGHSITDNPQAMKQLAEVIGAGTGRGTLGKLETAAPALATVMFSPRWLTSRFQILFNPLTKSGPARAEAIRQLAMTMGTSVAILGMLKMAGADVEVDPRSSDFGKAKIGNTRFDITGGLAPVITLFVRVGYGLARKPAIKSTTTGTIALLNSGSFGARTILDTVEMFFENKTSPAMSVIRDLMKGESFEGKPVELSLTKDFGVYLADQLIYPLITTDAYEAFTDASGGALMGVGATGASLFGVGVQTYAPSKKQQVRELYQEGDIEGSQKMLDEAVKNKDISETSKAQIIRDKDLPNDVIYFRDLVSADQEKMLKSMNLIDIQRFGWYANKDVMEHLSTLSDDTKQFVDDVNSGRIKAPEFKFGKRQ